MNLVNDFKHLNNTISEELIPHLYVNSYPKNKDFQRMLLQIITTLSVLYVNKDILYKENDPIPIKSIEVPIKDNVSGLYKSYEIIKRFVSQENIYEGRDKLGSTVHPRWIFFPLDDEETSIIFTFFFEKELQKLKTDNTQVFIVESQKVHDHLVDKMISKSILTDGL
ncbi:hypothetical protein [Fundicoccus culcitae]|uniref:Uncharacterized protein n=1 Tax=Fundicoccus culcitae TaxID=2969821 RepID=A0ABY5P8X4_9LACT|nr:hypothetical protein [Fundicoccus culcitae]UUX35196.1 hypothetical protein NRE15_06015 [Fundicoccus culcitae]